MGFLQSSPLICYFCQPQAGEFEIEKVLLQRCDDECVLVQWRQYKGAAAMGVPLDCTWELLCKVAHTEAYKKFVSLE